MNELMSFEPLQLRVDVAMGALQMILGLAGLTVVFIGLGSYDSDLIQDLYFHFSFWLILARQFSFEFRFDSRPPAPANLEFLLVEVRVDAMAMPHFAPVGFQHYGNFRYISQVAHLRYGSHRMLSFVSLMRPSGFSHLEA